MLATLIVQAREWLPRYGDSYWHDSIPESMRQSYVEFGERYLGKPWKDIPVSVFSEYKTTGNRSHYESLMFEKRRQLAALVLAEIVEEKGRFLKDIEIGLQSTLEETWWGLPAHYDYDTPRADCQYVDLFNAETASLVAYTRYMLSGEKEGLSPILTKRIDSEISRRVLQPAVENNYWWKRATNNWNPWICSNWLSCVLFCENDDSRKAEAIRQINEASLLFLNAYPEDGGCDEGPSYWDRAAASLFEVCYILAKSENQANIPLNHPKLKVMGSYIYKMYAGNGYAVNFSDTHGYRSVLNVSISYPFGLLTGDKTLCQYAAWYGKKNDILHKSAVLCNQSSNWPSLSRELIFLSHIQSYLKEQPQEPLLKDVWLPDLQIMTARTPSSVFYVAFKGGNNGESHNHNDVGSFVLYSNGRPLLIDPGVSEYNAKTAKDRYGVWTMQSDYHNLPRINGYSQSAGIQYGARVINHKASELSLDISHAYPTEAKVLRWERTISARFRNQIKVTEDFELSSFVAPSKLMFVTPIEPLIDNEGQIRLSDCRMNFNEKQLSAQIEDISSMLDPTMQRIWGQHLYRIVLEVRTQRLNQRIQYTISVEK